MNLPPVRNFAELLRRAAERFGDAVFLERRDSKGGDATTFRALHDEVRRVAAGLVASGVKKGDRVGLIAENRREWIVADLACAWIGAADVPRGTDTAPAELSFLLEHGGCRFAFVETRKVARELAKLRADLPQLETICILAEPADDQATLDLDVLTARGTKWLAEHPGGIDELARDVGPDDVLTVIYTSGTTANPKGVTLTHGNLLENIRMVEEVVRFEPGDRAISVLPSWHSYERIMDYVLLSAGSKLVYSDRRRVKEDLRVVKPTIFVAVPRMWEVIHDGIVAHCRKQTGMRRRLLEFVLANSKAVGARRAGPFGRAIHAVFARTILPRFLEATGGRLRIAVSGGGSLPAHVDECLLGIGVPLLNGYGLTETSPVVALRRPEDNVPYTIGPPVPRTQCEVRDDAGGPLPAGKIGLIWIKGPQVMRGYWRNDDQTRQVLVDGWLNSGDLGCWTERGHLRITGRAKDTIVLAGGENVEPERIETQIKTSPLVEQVVVLGQDQKTLGALLVPAFECLAQEIPETDWDRRDGVLRGAAVQKCFRAELDRLVTRATGFRSLERIASFRVLAEPMSAENGLLTQTMKVRRHVVAERFAPLIDELFRGATGDD
ncbi:MAG: long-chain fatty acid--CoA ligase [Planctomycetes bacterium]|nr:long-chain fatty acid--CoA ligase [Planctomycetota bacterium]